MLPLNISSLILLLYYCYYYYYYYYVWWHTNSNASATLYCTSFRRNKVQYTQTIYLWYSYSKRYYHISMLVYRYLCTHIARGIIHYQGQTWFIVLDSLLLIPNKLTNRVMNNAYKLVLCSASRLYAVWIVGYQECK